MAIQGKRLMECPTCYTLIAYLNGICPECGGSGVVEERDPGPGIVAPEKPDHKSALKFA